MIMRRSRRAASYWKCLAHYDPGYSGNIKRFFIEKYKRTYEYFFAVYAKNLK
jgi:hypothetical protein